MAGSLFSALKNVDLHRTADAGTRTATTTFNALLNKQHTASGRCAMRRAGSPAQRRTFRATLADMAQCAVCVTGVVEEHGGEMVCTSCGSVAGTLIVTQADAAL
jgi:hypothetical protein